MMRPFKQTDAQQRVGPSYAALSTVQASFTSFVGFTPLGIPTSRLRYHTLETANLPRPRHPSSPGAGAVILSLSQPPPGVRV